MDVGGHHVSIDGKGINLSYKEFELLQYFMSNQGRALTRESILIRCGIMTILEMPEQLIRM